jgi:hypothetical protein
MSGMRKPPVFGFQEVRFREPILFFFQILILRCEVRDLALALPSITENPACDRTYCRPAHHSLWAYTFLKYACEAADEYDHGADVLHDDGGIGDKRPKLVRSPPRITLKMVQEGLLVCVVVRILLLDP